MFQSTDWWAIRTRAERTRTPLSSSFVLRPVSLSSSLLVSFLLPLWKGAFSYSCAWVRAIRNRQSAVCRRPCPRSTLTLAIRWQFNLKWARHWSSFPSEWIATLLFVSFALFSVVLFFVYLFYSFPVGQFKHLANYRIKSNVGRHFAVVHIINTQFGADWWNV